MLGRINLMTDISPCVTFEDLWQVVTTSRKANIGLSHENLVSPDCISVGNTF